MRKILILLFMFIGLYSFRFASVFADTRLHYHNNVQVIVADDLYEINNAIEGNTYNFTFTPSISGYYVIETYGDVDTRVSIDGSYYPNANKGYILNEVIGFSATANTSLSIQVIAHDIINGHTILLQVRRQTISVFTVNVLGDVNTTENINTVEDLFSGMVHPYRIESLTSFVQSDINGYTNNKGLFRMNSEFMIFSSHGDTGVIKYPIGSSFYSFNADNLPDLSNVKLAIWASCYSASGGDLSVAQKSVDKGAQTAIGWTQTISVDTSVVFIRHLLNLLVNNQSESINELVYTAISLTQSEGGLGDNTSLREIIQVFGDASAIISLSDYTNLNNKVSNTNFIPIYDYIDPVVLPVISSFTATSTSITLVYTNNSMMPVKVYAERGDSTPDIYIGVILQPGQSYTHTYTKLASDTMYYFYVKYVDLYRTSRSSQIRSVGVRTWGNSQPE